MKTAARWLAAALSLALLPISLASAQDLKPIRLSYQTGETNVLISYALGTGLFKQHGLDVKVVNFPAGPAALPAFAAGEIDVGWMGEFSAVTGYTSGIPIEILFMERIDATNVRLSANPAAGISSLPDLKGKRIGVSIGSTSHYHLLKALEKANLKTADVTPVNLSPANMPPAYAAGQIDAAFTWEPNIGAVESAGAKTLATTQSLGIITGGVWIARKAFTSAQPETVQRFLKAWNQAQKDYKAKSAEVRQFEAKRLNLTSEQFDRLVEGQSVAHPSFEETLTADFLGVPGQELDSRLMKHVQGMGAFLLAEKRIQAMPSDWSAFFNTKPIQAYLAGQK
ncbi:NrtA/SsuA/CpmA family ABC transporter substrate-binding protein [Methylobacterium sp. Leaf91]|uniref:taurine ABC transporter substrate-binding protein n=1 Tax=Methylobacterium sp. Leaf91 TaxID=1736247 RepID=UPI0006F80D72|nr:NrtA/SsuA/CpmA family ABC transporter substrate-binding protein [Methylobacterium sp. Leaf91]KQO91158.1 aliphatic sulfonate ABC transporter substrate-binding protein [Methylobacterium sp. Leaf91]